MKTNDLDQALLDKARLHELLKRLIYRFRQNHRWRSSPVVKDLELFNLMQHDSMVLDFILKKMKDQQIKFHPFKKVVIQQENKAREIYVQNWIDKIILMRVQEVIGKRLNPNISKNVFSFQKGRGPIHAVEAFLLFSRECESNPYILQMDISKYGDNINQDILKRRLYEDLSLDQNFILRSIIENALTFEIINEEGERHTKDKGIATGSPLVPLFENYYLSPIDQFIESTSPLFYCRYGDDIVLAYNDHAKVLIHLEEIKQELQKLNLCIHPEKVKIIPFDEKASLEWLGYKVSGKLQTGSKEKHIERLTKEIKAEIHKHFYFLRLLRPLPLKIQGLKESLINLESKIYQKYTNRIFHFYTSEEETKRIDAFRIRETHKAICRNYRMNKREAWKLLRQVKHSSANQIRMKFLRKKQWPKVPLKN